MLPSVVAIVEVGVSGSVAVDEGASILRIDDRMVEKEERRRIGNIYEALRITRLFDGDYNDDIRVRGD